MTSGGLTVPRPVDGEDMNGILLESRNSSVSDTLPMSLMDRLDRGFPEPPPAEPLYPKATADIDKVDDDIKHAVDTRKHVPTRRHHHTVQLGHKEEYVEGSEPYRPPGMEARFQAMQSVMKNNHETYEKLEAVCKAMTQLKQRARHRSRRKKVVGMTALQWIQQQRQLNKDNSLIEMEGEDQESSVDISLPPSSVHTSQADLQRNGTAASETLPGEVVDLSATDTTDKA